uniref:Exosome complex component RRP41 n=2 Tax=Pongo abelii TaxID=9601 RepID=A0A8I5UQE3_PONAB
MFVNLGWQGMGQGWTQGSQLKGARGQHMQDRECKTGGFVLEVTQLPLAEALKVEGEADPQRTAECELEGVGLAHVSVLFQIRGSRARALPDRALVNCQYSSATFSTGERKRRRHGDRKSCEMGLQLRQTFEAAILTQLHPRSQIDIYVQVLQADGGTYAACVNAATLAVLDAGIPMRDFVCACSAGFVDGTALADLSHVEEAAGGPQLALALLPASGQIALLEMDARLHEDHLERVLEAAAQAARDVHTLLDRVVRQHVRE